MASHDKGEHEDVEEMEEEEQDNEADEDDLVVFIIVIITILIIVSTKHLIIFTFLLLHSNIRTHCFSFFSSTTFTMPTTFFSGEVEKIILIFLLLYFCPCRMLIVHYK